MCPTTLHIVLHIALLLSVCAASNYALVRARGLKKGDKILVKEQPNNIASKFVLATVTRNVKGPSTASYKPVVDAPVMILGGVALAT